MEDTRLRRLRLDRGLTLLDLARALDFVVTDATLSAWELGRVESSAKTAGVQALAKFYGIETDEAAALIDEARAQRTQEVSR